MSWHENTIEDALLITDSQEEAVKEAIQNIIENIKKDCIALTIAAGDFAEANTCLKENPDSKIWQKKHTRTHDNLKRVLEKFVKKNRSRA